jgi:hypothetical protein
MGRVKLPVRTHGVQESNTLNFMLITLFIVRRLDKAPMIILKAISRTIRARYHDDG